MLQTERFLPWVPGIWLDFFFCLAHCSSPEKSERQPRSMFLRRNQLEETLVRESSLIANRPKVGNKKYWGVGQVADHISTVDLWVLVRDGSEFLVYDVTGELSRNPLFPCSA